MTRTITSTEAKQRFGALIGQIQSKGSAVIIENRGEPAAVIISTAEYESLLEIAKKQKRAEALAGLNRLRAELDALQSDLTEAKADEFVAELSNDVMDQLVARTARSETD